MAKSFQTNEECFILFSVKDRDLIGTNELMGESFLSFQQIPRGDASIDMTELNQVILPLSTPVEKGRSIDELD